MPPRKGSIPLIFLPSGSALPATTNVQNLLLGDSDKSKLSPPYIEMGPLKLEKRMSDDNLNGGRKTKRSKAEKLTPQAICSVTDSELRDSPDVAASFLSGISATSAKDRDMRIEDTKTTSVCIDETTTPKIRNDDIIGRVSDTISVDSQEIGENIWTVDELKEKLREVINDTGNTKLEEKLAIEEVTNEVPIWKRYLSTIANRNVLEDFDTEHYNSFKKLDESIRRVGFKKGMPSGIKPELENLRSICEAASDMHLRQGWCDRGEIENQITTIEDFAEILTRDCERAISSSHGKIERQV